MAKRAELRIVHARRKRARAAARDGQSREADVPGAPGAILQLQRTAGNQAVQRLLRAGATFRPLQRKDRRKGRRPVQIASGPGTADEIEEAYAAGTLDQSKWATLVDHAEEAAAGGENDEAFRAYSTLYTDAAAIAQASRVVAAGGINLVTGTKGSCQDAKPGLNLSLSDSSAWGANATTALVDAEGKFGVRLNPRGTLQPLAAIVLSRSAFKRDKELTLGVLRHEMVHAEHRADDAANALLSDPKDASAPEMTSESNTELLAYIEGFMTMFRLSDPPPTDPSHAAYVELLGALDEGGGGALPWAGADPSVRAQAVGRLEEWYVHSLDEPQQEAFAAWVRHQASVARRDEIVAGGSATNGRSRSSGFSPGSVDDETLELMQRRTGGDVLSAARRMRTLQTEFFRALQTIVATGRKRRGTPMRL